MFDNDKLSRLVAIGLTTHILQRLATMPSTGAEPHLFRVTEVQREGVTLHDGHHELGARVLPMLITSLLADHDAIAVGDWVLAELNTHGEWWVVGRVPPVNQIARRLHDGRDKVTRVVLVSNVDTALLVMGLDHDFNLRRLERYIALAHLADLDAVVVLTKADLCAQVDARITEVEAILPRGAAVVALNALGNEPMARLGPWLQPGSTVVLLGSSGAGKSTLSNALIGTAVQRTGANRADDSRGRHTTTARTLHATLLGGCIIDTPGLRTLRLDGEAEDIGSVFGDISVLSARCRFRDCRHEGEPGCAVRDAVPPERLRSFHKLMREARRDSMTALERKAQVSVWKARGRQAKAVGKAKRG